MTKLYFDISDIVEFARTHNHVSGIQRVQQRVIASLAEKHGDQIICTYKNPRDGRFFQVPAPGVFSVDELDSKGLLARLDVSVQGGILTKGDVKQALRKYEHRKLYRSLKKAELYVSAYVAPGRLGKLGVVSGSRTRIAPLPGITPLSRFLKEDPLVFLGANWNDPTLKDMGKIHRTAGGRVVQMIYDLIPHTAPQYFNEGLVKSFRNFLNCTPEYTSDFICISEWTRNDLLKFLETQPSFHATVATAPLAHEFAGFPRNAKNIHSNNLEVKAAIQGAPFVLCVGTIEIRKNGIALLKAWQQLIEEGVPNLPQLVFAGKYGWKIDDFRALLNKNSDLSRHVTIISSPSDEDLACLYEHCLFSAYPSHYEGWGLPVGEAAWFGRYCLASNASSIPEVCGDLIDYIPPDDISALAAKVKMLMTHPDYIEQKERAIMASKARTWADVADHIYSLCTTPSSAA